MRESAPFVTEINVLRFELLSSGDSMLGAVRYGSRRYLGILTQMMAHSKDQHRLEEISTRVSQICDSLDRINLFSTEQSRRDAAQRLMTELRMIIDMHLHTLSMV
jgi:hypothetical protein